ILSGGFADTLCQNTTAYFGRFSLSWDGGGTPETRLRDWLDPNDTSIRTLASIENPTTNDFVLMQGRITTPRGEGIGGVDIVVVENNQTASTDIAGSYFLDDLLFGENYVVGPVKDYNYTNGVTTFDLVQIRGHILGTSPFTSAYQLITADVNDSDSVSTFDIVQCQKLVLNIDNAFENTTSWRFVSSGTNLEAIPVETYDYAVPNAIQINGITSDIQGDFIGVKIGDVNGSANPQE
ncbi:MAG: hypothetical protein AAF738_10545, partial [Bacteroidota bacterium]